MAYQTESDTWVCVASGPSLTQSDVDRLAHLPTIAVNNSWKLARHAKVIYAGDGEWWRQYGREIDIPAERWSSSQFTEHQFIHRSGWNSGSNAIRLAASFGAKRIILLGYDCSLRHGIHWHGAHDKTKNPDDDRIKRWHKNFSDVRASLKDVQIINCSRYTELACFERSTVDEILANGKI